MASTWHQTGANFSTCQSQILIELFCGKLQIFSGNRAATSFSAKDERRPKVIMGGKKWQETDKIKMLTAASVRNLSTAGQPGLSCSHIGKLVACPLQRSTLQPFSDFLLHNVISAEKLEGWWFYIRKFQLSYGLNTAFCSKLGIPFHLPPDFILLSKVENECHRQREETFQQPVCK